MSWLPPPFPPAQYPLLLRHATTWLPEALALPASVVDLARDLAAPTSFSPGRREAIARHILALAACKAGLLSSVARIPLFRAPGVLFADPRGEEFYWSLDPGVPPAFERSAVSTLAETMRPLRSPAEDALRPAASADVPGHDAAG